MASDHGGIVSSVEGDNPRVTVEEMAADWSARAILLELVRRVEDQMAAVDDLRANITALQGAVTAENAELAQVVASLQTAEAQITQLQTQVSQGGGVSEADLEALASAISDVTSGAVAAVASAQGSGSTTTTDPGTTPAPASPDPGTPADPGTGAPVGTTDPGAPVTDPTATTDPTVTDPTAGSPTDPTSTAPAGVEVNDRTVYTTTNDPSTIDPTTWTLAPVEVPGQEGGTPVALYFFAGDTDTGQENGASVPGFSVYTGPTQPTVAAGGDAGAVAAPDAGTAEG